MEILDWSAGQWGDARSSTETEGRMKADRIVHVTW